MSLTLPNKLPNKKVKLGDGTVLKLFSLFYTHPYLLNEDGWKLLNLGEEKLLVDTDSLHVFGNCEIRLKYDKEHITNVNLTSNLAPKLCRGRSDYSCLLELALNS